MHGPRHKEVLHRQAKAGRSEWCRPGGAALRTKEPCLHGAVWASSKATFRYSDAVQRPQQRGTTGLISLHAGTTWMDLRRRVEQSKNGATGTSFDCADSTRPSTQQGVLVWPYVARVGFNKRPGHICPGVAEGRLFTLAIHTRMPLKEETTTA